VIAKKSQRTGEFYDGGVGENSRKHVNEFSGVNETRLRACDQGEGGAHFLLIYHQMNLVVFIFQTSHYS
jgi:hypothetical protein